MIFWSINPTHIVEIEKIYNFFMLDHSEMCSVSPCFSPLCVFSIDAESNIFVKGNQKLKFVKCSS